MKRRAYCPACERPLSRCLCALAVSLPLPWRLVVLQDPSEVKNAKGSVALLRACLPELTLWRSENFAEHEDLEGLLKDLLCAACCSIPANRQSQSPSCRHKAMNAHSALFCSMVPGARA